MTSSPPIDRSAIEAAADAIRRGGLVAFPTETVYGLGADASDDAAVLRLYAAKNRPARNPLIAHVADAAAARAEGRMGAEAERLAEAFWPGPLTLVLPAAAGARTGAVARAGLPSIALRVPAHPVARALVAAVGRPVAAPSANRSGSVSPTVAAHVRAQLGDRIDALLDGGACPVGVESTIVSCLGDAVILRPGGVPREAIEAVLGRSLGEAAPAERPLAPGQLSSHYAPRAMLRLEATEARSGEAVLDFGGRLSAFRDRTAYRDLSAAGDLAEAAARLFASLHALDAEGVQAIAVAPVPSHGLGAAINDRLARAAAPRPGSA